MILENSQFYFFWKPTGVASTWGSGESFLDAFKDSSYTPITTQELEQRLHPEVYEYFCANYKNLGLTVVQDFQTVIANLLQVFTTDQEYGLVNRLDTDTSGLLYFAKDQAIYKNFHKQQKEGKIIKHYLARVHGNAGWMLQHGTGDNLYVKTTSDSLQITYPVMHHRQLDDRMVVIKDPTDTDKGRGKVLTPTTIFRVVSYDLENNESLLHITITKGVRHQIRAHLAGVGYPIVGEHLYAKADPDLQELCLWSIGMEIIQ